MIEEQATVVAVDGELAWVETRRKSACDACSMNKGCGTGVLSRLFAGRVARMQVLNPPGAQRGDQVLVGLDEAMLVRGSLAVYLLPLLAMLVAGMAGYGLMQALQPRLAEAASIVTALAGLGGGFLWLQRFSQRIRHDRRYQAVILRVLTAHDGAAFATTLQRL